ncbi:MAG: transglutaminase-like domain-containing protein [Oscillospiraceae bacterium]|jgi:transglutaminase-like putative cysteine protease|nr:transglutaminase-like domain-containing protein [Oscillospiraceae bacterium]
MYGTKTGRDRRAITALFRAALFATALWALSALISTPRAQAADTIIGNEKAKINTTNTADGYVKIAYVGGSTAITKTIINSPKGTQYTYDINNKGNFETYPLSEGDGSYKVGVYVNTVGKKFLTAYSGSVDVKLKDEFAPFLAANQYVNFTDKTKCVAATPDILKKAGAEKDLNKIKAVYEYVIGGFTYDKAKAASVQSGYLPVLDTVWDAKKGICFDYASMMTAMLRSQKIPAKLVVGYAGTTYHAWITVYTKETGWVNDMIEFDGKNWKLMDPTFASSGKESADVMKYIGDGKNYAAKYYY